MSVCIVNAKSAARVGRVVDHCGMQLASISPFSPVQPTIKREVAPAISAAPAAAAVFAHVAAPTASAPLAGVVDGVARLASAPTASLIDFPGIAAGDVFDIVKGSKVGFFKVGGEATVLRLDPDHATFKVKAGAFGMKVDVVVDVVQIGADLVRISSTGQGIPNTVADGRVVTSRTNFAEFERVDAPSEHTVLEHDGSGQLTIDTVVPTFGNAHLVLKRR